jgi:uncharacterized membrane protein
VDNRFKIVFSGELVDDIRAEEAIERLVSGLGVPEARARNLVLDGQRHVLKRNLDAESAEKYRAGLREAGLLVRVEPEETPAVELSLSPADDSSSWRDEAPGRCPACGSERVENGICLDCGVVGEKYRARHGRTPGEGSDEGDPSGPGVDPYAAPRADLRQPPGQGRFSGPRKVPTGHGLGWIVRGFWHFKTAPVAWLLITALFISISIVVGMVPYIGGLLTSVLGPMLIGGVMFGAREQEQGRELRLEHLFTGFSVQSGQLALVGVLYLAGVIAIAVLGGIVLGAALMPVVPGADTELLQTQDAELLLDMMGPSLLLGLLVISLLFIPLIMAVLFAPALVILDGLPASEAMQQSFSGCLKNVLPFLIYGLISLVMVFVGSIPFGLGLLVVWPILTAAVYVAYRDIYYR